MIINLTKNQVISQQEKYCRNLWSQGLGLMLSPRKNLVMVFPKERTVRLHNWLVFYPIDVLILNADKKIKEIKRNFRPFQNWSSETKGKYVVELGCQKEADHHRSKTNGMLASLGPASLDSQKFHQKRQDYWSSNHQSKTGGISVIKKKYNVGDKLTFVKG